MAPVYNREQRAASLGVVSVGCALGLGGAWRLPALLDRYGAAGFLLAYALLLVGLGLPMLMAEQMIGRRGRVSPADCYDRVARAEARTCRWRWIALTGGLASVLLLAVVSEHGAAAALHLLHQNPSHPLMLSAQGALFGVAGWVGAGTAEWRARAQTFTLVTAVGLLGVVLVTVGLTDAGAFGTAPWHGVELARLGWRGLADATRLVLLTLGLSLGTVLGHGASMPAGSSILRASGVHLALSGTTMILTLLVVGMTLVPYQIPPLEGMPLVLGQIPAVLSGTPGQVAWYGFVLSAALLAALGVLESVTDLLYGRYELSRRQAALLAAGAAWVLGGIGVLAGYSGGVMTLFRGLASDVLMPGAVLGLALFAGWFISRRASRAELGLRRPEVFLAWRMAVRYLAPLVLAAVLGQSVVRLLVG